MVIPAVVLLFLVGDPPAVPRLVVSVYVYAVNGEVVSVPVGHCPISESLEAVQPLSADRDSAAAVIVPPVVVCVVASVFDFSPLLVEPRL